MSTAQAASGTTITTPRLEITTDEQAALSAQFTYQNATEEGIAQMQLIREAGLALANRIVGYCPRSADRSAAVRHVREAIMTANAAIVLGGRGLS